MAVFYQISKPEHLLEVIETWVIINNVDTSAILKDKFLS